MTATLPSARRGSSCRADHRPVRLSRLGLIGYQQAWDQQRAHAAQRLQGGPDVLMLLEHPSVYTAGRRTRPHERPLDGTPVIDVDRGGKITWHGPGQLVGYPVVKLSDPIDVLDYVRRLEEALVAVCAGLGVVGGRVPGRTGVWVPPSRTRPERKVAAIGVRVARGVTQHGFALNCEPDLGAFGRIVPCGIVDAGVSSLTVETGRRVGVEELLAATAEATVAALDGRLPVRDHVVPGLSTEYHPD